MVYDGTIYVFSNVPYARENRITAQPDDLLVFLNRAVSLDYYDDHANRIVYHRKPWFDRFGPERLGVVNRYVYSAGELGLPEHFLQRLSEAYDWNYGGVPDNLKSPTTGYIVAKYMASTYPCRELVLVNFGMSVPSSTHRSPLHNWAFEDRDLSSMRHVTLV